MASSIAESPPPDDGEGLLAGRRSRRRWRRWTRRGRGAAARTRGRASGRCAPVEMMIDRARYSVSPTHTPNGRLGEVDPVDVGGHELRAEAGGLLADLHHQLGPEDAVGEAGEVLDVGGEHQLPAGADALDDDRVQVGPGGVDGGGQARGARADDDDVVDLGHEGVSSLLGGSAGPAQRAGDEKDSAGPQVGPPDPTRDDERASEEGDDQQDHGHRSRRSRRAGRRRRPSTRPAPGRRSCRGRPRRPARWCRLPVMPSLRARFPR